ncbi:cupin domain-containing protein [Ceratobasidium sp. AG-Ba]|nr:cupin domain-containing protein [Ceratobasidium sp. AG-Ba]
MQSHQDLAEPLPSKSTNAELESSENKLSDSIDLRAGNEQDPEPARHGPTPPADAELENKKPVDESPESGLVSDNNIDDTKNLKDYIVHAPDLLQRMSKHDQDTRQQACLSKATGMSGRIGVHYQVIPPGFRTSVPHAHFAEDELVFCLQGRGIVWQNGWTYPFVPGDVAAWKAGTGITHTIINDTKHLPGETTGEEEEDLILLVVGEDKPDDDKMFYPFNPELYDVPGCVPRAERPNETLPDVQNGARPSNIINWKDQLAEVGHGELSAYATSLSQETGLSGRFGCNLEVAPPGTRSSDPHAHSLEDELVFVIQGEGLVWLDGQVFPVSAGDAVGFKGGTGLAHTFINDSNALGGEGQDLVTWIVGENRRSEDRVVYPLHPEKKTTFKRWWEDSPKRKLGDHPGRPTKPHSLS